MSGRMKAKKIHYHYTPKGGHLRVPGCKRKYSEYKYVMTLELATCKRCLAWAARSLSEPER